MTTQLTREQAVKIARGLYLRMSKRELALFQLSQKLLCVPFSEYHGALEELLGRPVWTHELARPEKLLLEFFGLADAQNPIESLEEIMKGPAQ